MEKIIINIIIRNIQNFDRKRRQDLNQHLKNLGLDFIYEEGIDRSDN